MKGLKLRTVIGLFCLVLIGAGVLVAHVWKQNVYVRLSMDLAKLGKAESAARNEIALLELSVGNLKKMSRLENLARNRFGLEYVKDPILVYLDAAPAERGRNPKHPAVSAAAAEVDEGTESLAGAVAWPTSGL